MFCNTFAKCVSETQAATRFVAFVLCFATHRPNLVPSQASLVSGVRACAGTNSLKREPSSLNRRIVTTTQRERKAFSKSSERARSRYFQSFKLRPVSMPTWPASSLPSFLSWLSSTHRIPITRPICASNFSGKRPCTATYRRAGKKQPRELFCVVFCNTFAKFSETQAGRAKPPTCAQ